jgi:hypothetical protein
MFNPWIFGMKMREVEDLRLHGRALLGPNCNYIPSTMTGAIEKGVNKWGLREKLDTRTRAENRIGQLAYLEIFVTFIPIHHQFRTRKTG